MNTVIGSILSRLTTLSSASVEVVRNWLLMPILLAVAAGSGFWAVTSYGLLEKLADNKVPQDERIVTLVYVGVAFLLISVVYGLVILRHKQRTRLWPTPEVVRPLNSILSALFILPIVGVLAVPDIAKDEPILVLFLIGAAAVASFPVFMALARLVSTRMGEPSASNRIAVLSRYGPSVVVGLLFVGYCVYISTMSINTLRAFRPLTWDMAIYTNLFYHSAHGNPLGSSLVLTGNHAAAHFDPILILLSPLFLIHPGPETLCVIQTVWLGLGVFPTYRLAGSVLGNRWAGAGVAAIYLIHPSLQLVNLCDFHSLALIGTPLMFALYFLEARYYKRLFAMLPIILLIREDAALVMCFFGIAAILSNRKDAWVGTLTILISLIYFAVVKGVFMPSSDLIMSDKGTYNYTSYFEYMIPHEGGVRDIGVSMLTNPIYTLRYVISMDKLTFVLKLLGPLMFIPLFAKKWRFLLLYSVIFVLLSSRFAVPNTTFHYQILPYPVLIALLPFGIQRILACRWFRIPRPQFSVALIGALLVSAILNGVMFGALSPEHAPPRYRLTLSEKEQDEFEAVMGLIDQIPKDASVITSTVLAPFVANRETVYLFRKSTYKTKGEYILIDRTKREKVRDKFDKWNRKHKRFEIIDEYKRFVLYKRKA